MDEVILVSRQDVEKRINDAENLAVNKLVNHIIREFNGRKKLDFFTISIDDNGEVQHLLEEALNNKLKTENYIARLQPNSCTKLIIIIKYLV